MTTTYQYEVAGHRFAIKCDNLLANQLTPHLEAYQPFAIKKEKNLFEMSISTVAEVLIPDEFVEEARQEEEGQIIVSGHLAGEKKAEEKKTTEEMAEDKKNEDKKNEEKKNEEKKTTEEKAFFFEWDSEKAWLTCSADYRQATLFVPQKMVETNSTCIRAALDTSLMLIYAFATATKQTLLFHSSTVVWNNKAYMFLGKSGTGKSTHTRLWLKYIEGTHLLNDDNPVVRIAPDGTPMVCGSPWSGKTPCYKNEVYPIGGIVKLNQYPENKIRALSVLEAYAVIKSSVSSKRWELKIADGLHYTTEAIIKRCKTYQLDCLPDEAAARLSWKTIAIEDSKE